MILFHFIFAAAANDYFYTVRSEMENATCRGGLEMRSQERHVIVIKATHDAETGEELFINYNKNINSVTLMLQYGFLVPDHSKDFFQLRLTLMPEATEVQRERNTTIESCGWSHTAVVGRDGVIPFDFISSVIVGSMPVSELEPLRQLCGFDLMKSRNDIVRAFTIVQQHIVHGLSEFPTTMEEDKEILQRTSNPHLLAAVLFRLEMKKLLKLATVQIEQSITSLKFEGKVPVPQSIGLPDDIGGVSKDNLLLWPMTAVEVFPGVRVKAPIKERSAMGIPSPTSGPRRVGAASSGAPTDNL